MMRASEMFHAAQQAEEELKILRARVRHYEDLGLTITSTGNASGSGNKGASRVEIAVVGMIDAARDLEAKMAHYAAIVAHAENVISRIESQKFRQILTLHYLCGWSLKSISDELGYRDTNSVYRAKGWALRAAQQIINREEELNRGREGFEAAKVAARPGEVERSGH